MSQVNVNPGSSSGDSTAAGLSGMAIGLILGGVLLLLVLAYFTATRTGWAGPGFWERPVVERSLERRDERREDLRDNRGAQQPAPPQTGTTGR